MTAYLYAGKDNLCKNPIGTVEVYHDGSNIYVTYKITAEGWYIEETHFDFGVAESDFPLTKTGNPQVGLFSFGDTNLFTTEKTYVISKEDAGLADLCEPFFVATHAVVSNPGDIITVAPYAATVVDSSAQGMRKDGTAVLPERSIATNALVY